MHIYLNAIFLVISCKKEYTKIICYVCFEMKHLHNDNNINKYYRFYCTSVIVNYLFYERNYSQIYITM